MFETYNDAELTLLQSLDKDECRQWAYVYRRRHTPWLHVVCRPTDPTLEYSPRIFFFTDVSDLVALASNCLTEIVEVCVVTPQRINGTDCWHMDRLAQVRIGWQYGRGLPLRALVYTLYDGRILVDSSDLAINSEISDTEVIWPLQGDS